MPGYTPLSDSTPEDTHNPSLQGDEASIGGTWAVEMEKRLLSTEKKKKNTHNCAPSLPPSHTEFIKSSLWKRMQSAWLPSNSQAEPKNTVLTISCPWGTGGV